MKYKTKGSLLVGNMIALVILGVSASGLIYYTSTVQRVVKSNIESVEYKPVLKTALLNSLKSLLIAKNIKQDGTPSEHNIYGICSLVQPLGSEIHGAGIAPLKLNLHNIQTKNNPSWSESRWKHFFPPSEYEFVSGGECQRRFRNFRGVNNLSKCLRYIGSDLTEVWAFVSWTPKAFPNLSPIDTTPNDPETARLDPKKVVFYLKVELAGAEAYEESERSALTVSGQTDMIWANDVGECHVSKGAETVLVKFTGTGPGSNLNISVINSPYNIDQSDIVSGGPGCQNLKIGDINQDIVQAGNVRNLLLSSLTTLNARVSCTRNTFKCKSSLSAVPNETDILDGYDDFQFNFELASSRSQAIPVSRIDFTFKKSDGKELDGENDGRLKDTKAVFSNPLTAEEVSSILKPFTMQANISNEGAGKRGIKKACHSICQNTKPKVTDTYIYPALKIVGGNNNTCVYKKDWSDDESHRVHCTVCYTKACHRFGLGTFGPYKKEFLPAAWKRITTEQQDNVLRELPDEALDNPLPECAIKDNKIKTQVSLPASALETNKCIALEIEKTDSLTQFNSSIYSAQNCDTKLPVLCFSGGQYRPAMKVPNNPSPSTPLEVVESDFKGAQKACLEMGQEVGTAFDLGILLFNMGVKPNELRTQYAWQANALLTRLVNQAETAINSLPKWGGGRLSIRLADTKAWSGQAWSGIFGTTYTVSDGMSDSEKRSQKYNFINNATRGMFLAPPTGLHVSYITKRIKDQIASAKSKGKMWVALEGDAGGFVMASPPYAEVAKDHPFALYFAKGPGSPITLLKDTSTLSSSSPYLALAHSVRWKGLYPSVSDTTLPYLCKKEGKFFVTTKKGTIKDTSSKPYQKAHKTCKNEGGEFLPPLHSNEWAEALLALNPHDPHLPFPDPELPDRPTTGNSFLYQKAVQPKKAWVALKLKEGLTSSAVDNDTKIQVKAEDLRWIGNFSADSLFYNPDEDGPHNANNMGIINGKGEWQPIPSNALLNLDLNDPQKLAQAGYNKLCLNKSKVKLKAISLNETCSSSETAVTGSDLKNKYSKSLRFMLAWKESHLSQNNKFIIDKSLLEQAQKQAQNKKCKDTAGSVHGMCSNTCSSQSTTCKNACPADQPPPSPHANQACRSGCDTTHQECRTDCDNKKTESETTCDTQYPL